MVATPRGKGQSAEPGRHHGAGRRLGHVRDRSEQAGGLAVDAVGEVENVRAAVAAASRALIGPCGSRSARSCSESEHDALAPRDGPGAAAVMEHHLKHIEGALGIGDGAQAPVDVRRLFGSP